MPPSVSEPRLINIIDYKNDVSYGIPAHKEEETEAPISELAMPRTRDYAELG
jgi:hypothetical protein